MAKLPLQGVRIVDASQWRSGPMGPMLLGDMGAEVIKVESVQHMDPHRLVGTFSGGPTGERLYERCSIFNWLNRNKYGITLDLTQPRGVELFQGLVKISDVVVENLRPGVWERFGLGYPALKKVNPTLIMISLPGFGTTGPWKDYVSWATPVDQMAGFSQLVGYPGGPPITRALWTDSVSAVFGAYALLAALHYRRKTGKGQFIDLSQLEANTCLNGEALMDYLMNRRVWPRAANRHPARAPHGCFRCRGAEAWVAIAVSSEEEWRRLCQAMGNPPWTQEERFSDPLRRAESQGELNALVEQWTLQQDKHEVARLLQAAGVPSGPVATGSELLRDPHLIERGFLEEVGRAEVGTHTYPGASIVFSRTPTRIRRLAPLLGEHNEYILTELLGVSRAEMEELETKRIIGTVPLQA